MFRPRIAQIQSPLRVLNRRRQSGEAAAFRPPKQLWRRALALGPGLSTTFRSRLFAEINRSKKRRIERDSSFGEVSAMSLRPRIYVVFILCLWLLTPVQGADAQQGILAPPDPAQADHTQESTPGQAHAGASTSASDEEGLIRLDVTVHDENGDPVSGLTPTDFTLLENNKPDKILSFRAFDAASQTTEPPVELILFLDTVSLSESQASVMRRETAKFLRQNGGHLSQPVSIFWLAASGLWIPPQAQPSFDGNGLAEALEYGSELQSIWSARNAQRAGTPDPSFLNFLPLRTFGWIASAERQTFGRKILVWIGPSSTMGTGAGQNLFDTIVWFSTRCCARRESHFTVFQ